MGVISPPQPIHADLQLAQFDCGVESLNRWLKNRAWKNELINASRTYVVCGEQRVVGYYCLSTGSIKSSESPGKIKRNMPSPIPVMLLGRLAVDKHYQGMKIAKGLLKDAVLKTFSVSEQVGLKGLVVHALDDNARHFYKAHGFIEFPNEPRTLILPISSMN